MRRSERDAQLAELYALIPRIPGCDGSCWISCGPIDMSDRERQRTREAGYRITPGNKARFQVETFWCEALTAERRCAVYDMRPMVCRLWGAVEDMKCPAGCVPEGGWLTAERGRQLIAASIAVGSNASVDPAVLATILRADAQRHVAAGEGGIQLRRRSVLPAGFRSPERTFQCASCGFTLAARPNDPPRGICGECGAVVETGGSEGGGGG